MRTHRPDRSALAAVVALVLVVPAAGHAAQREHAATETFAAPDGTRVVIDAATVDVQIRTADVDRVAVATELRIAGVGEDRAASWIASHTPTTEVADGRITVTVSPGRSGFLGLGTLTARSRLGFLLPHHVVPDITTTGGSVVIRGDLPDARPLYLRTATGDMELVGAAASVDLRSASGDARLELIRPLERFFARTSSGNVTLTGGAREVHVDTASGSVWMDNLSGSTEVVTSTGRITLAWDRLEPHHRVVVRSDSSRIRLTLPESAAPRGSLRTIGGTVRSDFPGVVNEAGDTVTLSGEGPELLVESASGDIVLAAGTWWGGDTTAEPPLP
ncbi:MAG TPA: DUF4097 family beta strand repeat-containing protein [Methylomirabilota bacterium]|nr:DUF4097 family beta strand repeat-containing protein [Methylomirabilota bacterium]